MKKNLFLCTLVLLFSSFLPMSFQKVEAQSTSTGFAAELKMQTEAAAGEQGAGFGKAQAPQAIIARIIQMSLGLLGILLVSYLIYGGAVIFLSAGSEDKVNEGKAIVRRAILGIVIIMSAYSITILVTKLVTGSRNCTGTDCTVIEEDRRKYTQPGFDDTNPFTPYGEPNCRVDFNGNTICE